MLSGREALKELEIYRKKKELKKRKRVEEQEKKKKMKLEWKEKMSDVTNLNRRKLHKTSKSEQWRKFEKEKEVESKRSKNLTESNVVEKWTELY